MEVVLSLLCGLAIVVLVITVVGHLLWLFFAAIVRAMTGEESARHATPARPCPTCGRIGTVVEGRCRACGAVPAISSPTTLTQELEATARHLERMLRRGIIRPEEYERMRDAIRIDLARLAQASSAVPSPGTPAGSESVVHAALVESPPAPPALPHRLRPAESASPAPVAESPFAAQDPLAPVRVPGVVHPLDKPEAIKPPPPPQPPLPARTFADMLQSFMEESNIRWGEVIAGTLIVVCAIGLVISLRSTLRAIPYAPALLFMLFTVAFHGAGLYSLRRWKLHAISRVILIIALLLVPLGFSAGIVLSGTGETRRAVTDPLFLAALAIGTLVFGWVTISAARETVGQGWWRLSLAVLGSSLAQVVVSRLASAEMSLARTLFLGGLPLACFFVASGGQLLSAGLRARMNRSRVVELLLVLGIALFALLVPLALLVHSSDPRFPTIANLSPIISLAAASVLAAGLAVQLRTLAKPFASYRFAGTAVAVTAGMAMAAAVALAWPRPGLLLIVGIANGIVLAGLGIVSRVSVLHAAALACGALAAVIATHHLGGTLPLETTNPNVLLHALISCRSGLVLTVLAATACAGGWQLRQLGRREDGAMLLGSAGVLSLVCAVLAALVGYVPQEVWRSTLPHDALWAAPLLVVHGLALLAFAPAIKQPAVAVGGSALLWLGLVHAVAWNEFVRHALNAMHLLPARPVLCATLIHSVLTALLSLATAGRGVFSSENEFGRLSHSTKWKDLIQPLSLTAVAALVGALPFILWAYAAHLYWHALYAALGATVCLAMLLIWRHSAAFGALQAMLALSVGFLTAAICRSQLAGADWRFDWRHFNAQLITVALAAAAWSIFRRYSSRWPTVRQLLTDLAPTVDQGLLAFAAVALPLLAIAGVWPGIMRELDAKLRGMEMPIDAWTASAGSLGDWLAVAAVAGALLTLLVVEGRGRDALGCLVAALFAVPWLAAGWFAEPIAVASAARWGLAVYVAGFCAVSLVAGRWPTERKNVLGNTAAFAARPLFAIWPFVLGTVAILAITIAVVAQSLSGNTPGGPAAGSWFARIGPTLSFGLPLSVLVVASLAFSLVWRRTEMSVLASALFQLTANLAFLIHLSSSTAASVPVRWVEWLQWNALALGLFGVVWSGIEAWKKRLDANLPVRGSDLPMERLGNLAQLFLCGMAVRGLALWAAGAVALDPDKQLFVTAQLGDWPSYVALGFAAVFLVWRSQRRMPYMGLGIVAVAAMLVALAAATCDGYDPTRQWLAYHVLTMGLLGVSVVSGAWYAAGHWVAIDADQQTRILRWPVPTHWAAGMGAALVALLALRGVEFDPQAPWWSSGAALGSVAIFCALGVVCRSQIYAYLGTLTAIAPVAIFLSDAPWWAARGRFAFVELSLLPPLLVAAFWLWREVRSQRREGMSFDAGFPAPAVHRFAAAGGLAVLTLVVAARLLLAVVGETNRLPEPTQVLIEVALGAALALWLGLLAGSLWDRRALGTIPFLYGGGLLVAGWGLHLLRWPMFLQIFQTETQPISYVELLAAASPMAVGAYVALTGELWHRGAQLGLVGQRLGISDPVAGLERTVRWLPAVSILLTVGVCALSFFGALSLHSLALRVLAAFAPAACAWGIARQAQQQRETPLQLTSLALAGLSAVLLGWAEMPPEFTEELWMTRTFRLLMALSALTFLYGLALPRFLFVEGAWNRSFQRAGYGTAVLAMAAFIAVLALELAWFVPGEGAPVADAQVVAVAVVLVALIAGLISLALFPERDPLALSETGRTGYVYAAEAVLALLFAHLYLCKPMWFGELREYWPYIVMAIAYVGVGASEILSRLKVRVLAEPLRNTGALLPLLPAIAMWMIGPLEGTEWQAREYALVLFLAGLMYLAVSMTQRSWIFAAAAGVAGNGALWAMFDEYRLDFTQNPQSWLIPPAVSVLVAAHLNRDRLDPKLLTAVRYAATIVIYLSSTSEIFLHGIGESVWKPIILLALSLLGALAGVMFRVRAFLYLGASFTLMALFTMVWHAARAINETWPWWAFGIGVGIAVLALLALFEKKKDDVRALVARLQKWEQ
jgi:hypothetical protein